MTQHFNVIIMCLPCSHRWVGMVECQTSLFRLECPDCGAQDSFASFIPDEYLEDFSLNNPEVEDAQA